MAIIDDANFLAKNYESKSTFFAQNSNEMVISIETDKNGNILEEHYKSGIKVSFKTDENGNITSEIWKKEDKIVYSEFYKYEFDNNGCLRKSYFAKFDGPKENDNWQIIEEYDDEGTVIKIAKDYEGDGNIDYVEEFDTLFNNRTKKIFDINGKIINVQHYEYDENGKIISSTYDKDGDGSVEYQVKY